MVQVGGLLVPGCRVEIDLIALEKGGRHLPLEQGTLAGETLYAGGRSAASTEGTLAAAARPHPAFPYYASDIERQTRYVLESLRATYRAAGWKLAETVKAQVFLTDLKDFYYFDQVWKEFFPAPPPRTTVQVSALPVAGCRVGVDLTAVKT